MAFSSSSSAILIRILSSGRRRGLAASSHRQIARHLGLSLADVHRQYTVRGAARPMERVGLVCVRPTVQSIVIVVSGGGIGRDADGVCVGADHLAEPSLL